MNILELAKQVPIIQNLTPKFARVPVSESLTARIGREHQEKIKRSADLRHETLRHLKIIRPDMIAATPPEIIRLIDLLAGTVGTIEGCFEKIFNEKLHGI